MTKASVSRCSIARFLEAGKNLEEFVKSENWFREQARAQRHCEGDIEIDDNAPVSIGNDRGAYVQAWVWVPADDDAGELIDCLQFPPDLYR